MNTASMNAVPTSHPATARYRATHFLISANQLSQLPPDECREVALAGRSNAGKSSALNLLTGQKKLARISKTPGRTQLINYFEVEPYHYLVDLPGYGYAKVPEAMRPPLAANPTGVFCATAKPVRFIAHHGYSSPLNPARPTNAGLVRSAKPERTSVTNQSGQTKTWTGSKYPTASTQAVTKNLSTSRCTFVFCSERRRSNRNADKIRVLVVRPARYFTACPRQINFVSSPILNLGGFQGGELTASPPWKYPSHTTELSQSVSEWVTITHPHHPLYRQRVEVLTLRRGNDPDLIVRLPDQSHAAVAMSWTDYAGVTEPPPSQQPLSLLSLSALRKVAQLIDTAPSQ